MSADLSREMCNTTLGPPKDSEVIFADLARGGQNSYLAVLLTRGADGSTHTCRWRVNSAADRGCNFSMSKPRWDPLQAPAAPSAGHGDNKTAPKALLTCALHRPPPHSNAQPTLSVVWESLAWQRFRIGTGTSPTLETTFHLSGVQSAPRVSPPVRGKGAAASAAKVVACALESDYMLVIGRDAGDKADTSTACNRLTAWDCLYGTTQGTGHLRWSSDEENTAQYSGAGATAACAAADGSLLVVALDKCVVVCGVESGPMSLDMVVAAAAGSRESSMVEAATAMRPVDVMACLAAGAGGGDEEGLNLGGADVDGAVIAPGPRRRLAQAVEEGNSREGAILQQVASDTKSSKWVEAVKLYLEDLQAEAANAEAARRAPKPHLAARRRGGSGGSNSGGVGGVGGSSGPRGALRIAVSDHLVGAVVRRCTEQVLPRMHAPPACSRPCSALALSASENLLRLEAQLGGG
jgi:hypothetical protein